MRAFFLPSLLAAPMAMVCSAAQVPSTIDAQIALLKQIQTLSITEAVDAIMAIEPPENASTGYLESLKTLKTVAILTGCLIADDAAQKEAYTARSRAEYPGVWFMLHMATPELFSTPDLQHKLVEFLEQLSPQQLKQDTALTALKCAMLVSREGKQITPERRKEIVLNTLKDYPMDPGALSILAVHYLYPEHKMQDATAATYCILAGAQARCTPTQLFNPTDAYAHSLLMSLAYAAAQQQAVDTLALQFGALSLAIQLDTEKPWAHYRMAKLWLEHASHPCLEPFSPKLQAINRFEIAAREGHAPSLYALGKEISDPELMAQAVDMGYDVTVDYRHVSPGATVNYSVCTRVASYLPSETDRLFSGLVSDTTFYLVNKIVEFSEQQENVWGKTLIPLLEQLKLMRLTDIEPVTHRADCLTATDDELLAAEMEGFRHLLKLREGESYELYKLYRDGSDPTGEGKDAALAEQYLRRAAIIDANEEALLELANQSDRNEQDRFMAHLLEPETDTDALLVCFFNMANDPLCNVLPLDDALQAWAAKHPQQSKLAEALRIHYLLFVHNKSWKTSPENNAAAREVRKRLIQIIRTVPETVIDAPTKNYLQQIFETQDAAEARDLRRWYAARNITPPQEN